MRTKVTLVLLFLNVALFYFIFQFVVWNDATPHTRKVLPRQVAALDRIEIRPANVATPLVLEKRGDNWFLGAPYDWPADKNAVERLINELLLLENETSFEVAKLGDTGQKLADYGLDPAAIVLHLAAGDSSFDLKIGAATQVQNRLYVLDPAGTRIHVVGRSLVEALMLGPDQFRSTALVDIPVFEARSLAVQLPAPGNLRVRLARSPQNQRWTFESPIQTRADKNAVELVLSGIRELAVASFLDTPPAAGVTGLDNPAFRLTIEGTQRRTILLLGAPVPTEAKPGIARAETELYAKLDDRAALFTVKVSDDLLDDLRNAQTKLRERRLLDFEPAHLTAISLTAPGQPEVALQRLESGTWQVLSRQGTEAAQPQSADPAVVARLIEQLGQLRAVTFQSDAPFPADLEQWGFNRAEREVVLTLASEQSAQPVAVTLQLGVTTSESGQPLTYARVADTQFVYQVRSAILEELPVVARHYRLRTLRDLPPGARIAGISLRRVADNSVVFAKDLATGQTWDSALESEKPEIKSAVQQLLGELRTLRARDFVRDAFAATLEIDGQPQPWIYQLDITVALSAAGEAERTTPSTLLLGERQGGTSLLVGSSEFNTVFHATQPFLDSVFALTFGSRDPGPPPAQPAENNGSAAKPEAAPAAPATPPAPAPAAPNPAESQ